MAKEIVKLERRQNYAIVALNRPEKRNAINQTLIDELHKALAQVENDKEIRALVLRGEGATFCSGIDLQQVDQVERGNANQLEILFKRLEALAMPTVAAIQGAAFAGGLQLALHCDLRIAAEDAKVGMPLGRVGLTVTYDLGRKLIAACGWSNTAWILYTADPLDARRAREIGLVNEVVPTGELNERALRLAEKIASNAPLSLRLMKLMMRRSMSEAFDAYHDDLVQMTSEVFASQDAKEGARAFIEKRKPQWRGQ